MQTPNFMKIRPEGKKSCHARGQTYEEATSCFL